jgi:hypothetical protein
MLQPFQDAFQVCEDQEGSLEHVLVVLELHPAPSRRQFESRGVLTEIVALRDVAVPVAEGYLLRAHRAELLTLVIHVGVKCSGVCQYA